MTTDSVTPNASMASAQSSSAIAKPKRYHPLLVALHWLIAIMIFGAFFLVQGGEEGREGRRPEQGNFPQQGFQQQGDSEGFEQDEAPQGNFPQGNFPAPEGAGEILSSTGLHMIVGLVILVLLIIRLIVRWTTKHPDWASAGNKFFDVVGNLTHFGLYLLTFAMVITGIILADQRGELARTLGIGTFSPDNFRRGGFSLGFFHGGIWTLLLLLILLHIGAALYHQFIIKDNLLGRMWFGKRDA